MAKEYKIKELKNGERRYIFDVNIGYRADGSRIRKTVTAKTIKDGRKRVAELTLKNNGKVVLQKDNTFCKIYDLYIFDCINRGLSSNTINTKNIICRKSYARFEKVKLNKITDIDITEWIKDISETLSSRTVKNRESELNTFFNWCIKKKYIETNPFIYVNRTKPTKTKIIFYTEKQFNDFIVGVTNKNHKLIFQTLFYTGLRKSELCGLSFSDLDIENNELHLSHTVRRKGNAYYISDQFKNDKSKRIVPVPKWLTPKLEIFLHKKEFPLKSYYSNLDAIITKYLVNTELPKITIHGLRHSYVSMLINKGVDIYTISCMVGHGNINTTIDTYGDLYPDKRQFITSLFDQNKKALD